MGGHAVQARDRAREARSGRDRGRDHRLREPRGRDRLEHRAPDRDPRRLPGRRPPASTVNRFCSSGLQTIAIAAQRIMTGEGEIYAAGGVESISCVQNEMNKHMFTEDWLDEAQAGGLLADAADGRVRREEVRDRPRGAGPLRRAEPAPRRGGARGRQVQGRDRADRDADEGGRQGDRRRNAEGDDRLPGRRYPPRHHLRGRVANQAGGRGRRDRRRQRQPVLRRRVGLQS